mmetsp:Transcript_433/g.1480  ORF Transcript_433/g.1480 Transcript_433/m.1480 type:complete len:240 (+) Transcript_433:96-815(+)
MSDDRVEISSVSLTLSAYPHARPECPSVPIERGLRGCDLCYCYVCDCHASRCRQWASHYRGSGRRAKWRAVKRVRANVAAACNLARDDGRSVAEHVVALIIHASQDRMGLPLFADTVDATQDSGLTNRNRPPSAPATGVACKTQMAEKFGRRGTADAKVNGVDLLAQQVALTKLENPCAEVQGATADTTPAPVSHSRRVKVEPRERSCSPDLGAPRPSHLCTDRVKRETVKNEPVGPQD